MMNKMLHSVVLKSSLCDGDRLEKEIERKGELLSMSSFSRAAQVWLIHHDRVRRAKRAVFHSTVTQHLQ